jgi:hypothetical protein
MRSEIREMLRQRNSGPVQVSGSVVMGGIPEVPAKMDIRTVDARLKTIEQTERQLSVEKFQLNKIRVSLLKELADHSPALLPKQMSQWAQDIHGDGFQDSPSRTGELK